MTPADPPRLVLNTFFASREPCRLPEALLLAETLRRAGGIPCSISLRAGQHFVITPARRSPGSPAGTDTVEVADYDPVRHTALVIGPSEPSPDTPIHWLSYRTDELVGAVSFVWSGRPPEGVPCTRERHPPGSFMEAMSVVSLARERGGAAAIEERGVLVTARDAGELLARLGAMAPAAETGTSDTGTGDGRGAHRAGEARGEGRG